MEKINVAVVGYGGMGGWHVDHIRNMESVTAAGCVVLPPVLTFYSGAQTARDMVDHILGKALLQYDITLPGFRAWEGK